MANAFSHSYIVNSRNLESHWYGPWSIVLESLVFNIPSAVVVPQFTLWFNTKDDKGDESDEGDEVGDDVQNNVPSNEYHHTSGSISDNESSHQQDSREKSRLPQPVYDNPGICTVAIRKPCTCIPDFSLLLLELEAVCEDIDPGYPQYCDGIKVSSLEVGAIVENKSAVSRGLELDTEAYKMALAVAIDEAREGLFHQAAHLFLNYPDYGEVMAIAAAGAEWTYAVLRREHVRRRMDQIAERDPAYGHRRRAGPQPVWAEPARLHSTESNKNFKVIYDYLSKKARVGMTQLRNV